MSIILHHFQESDSIIKMFPETGFLPFLHYSLAWSRRSLWTAAYNRGHSVFAAVKKIEIKVTTKEVNHARIRLCLHAVIQIKNVHYVHVLVN